MSISARTTSSASQRLYVLPLFTTLVEWYLCYYPYHIKSSNFLICLEETSNKGVYELLGAVVRNNLWARRADGVAHVYYPAHQLGQRSKQINQIFLACDSICSVGFSVMLLHGQLSLLLLW